MSEIYSFKGIKREQLITEILRLRDLVVEQEAEIAILQDEAEHVQKLKSEFQHRLSEAYWTPAKNERGAGRKTVLTKEIIIKIKQLRTCETPFLDIAQLLGLSVGVVHKASQMQVVDDDTHTDKRDQLSFSDL